MKRAAEDLIDTLFANNPQVGAVRISIIPYSSAVNIGAAYFTAATNQGAGADTCVVERGTMPGAIVDDAPRPGRWAETSNSGANGQYHCPASQVQPLLDIAKPAEQTTLRNLINSLNPDGWTAGHIGLAWGWYSVSPNWSAFWPANNQPKPQSPDVLKGVLLMTDGMFNTAYFGGNKNGDDPTVVHSSGDQALGLCQNIRDAGVALFTVAFDAPVSAADLLTTCAGGAGNAFTAATSSELRDKFRLVADRLSSLRIAK